MKIEVTMKDGMAEVTWDAARFYFETNQSGDVLVREKDTEELRGFVPYHSILLAAIVE